MPLVPSPVMAATGETVAAQGEKPARESLQERFGKMLKISTKIDPPKRDADGPNHRTPKGERSPNGRSAANRASGSSSPRGIRQIDNFNEIYVLGREVMPSTHSYMKVHFATRKQDGAEVVVKLRFKPKCFRSKEDERNWRRSTEYLLNMPDNSHIAAIYDVLEDPKTFYIVMEKVSGMDLFETLEQEYVSVEDAREILRQLLTAMAHLHAHNAVHKDLKLENVMIDSPKKRHSEGMLSPTSVKVIDFDTLDQWTPASPVAKDVVGTDQYIAQEAYAGKYSPLSDVFAVGVIAYKLLCGRFPFHEEIFDDEAGENWVGSPKMLQIRRRLKVAKVDFSQPVFREQPLALDLVTRMLAYNEQHRPTAAAAMQHRWFQEDRTPAPPAEGGYSSLGLARAAAARNVSEDLLDDGIIVAEEAVVGDGRRQALLRM